jgi:hypothetical protein
MTKTNKKKNTTQKTKKMSNTGFTKNRSELRCPRRACSSCLSQDTRHVTHIVIWNTSSLTFNNISIIKTSRHYIDRISRIYTYSKLTTDSFIFRKVSIFFLQETNISYKTIICKSFFCMKNSVIFYKISSWQLQGQINYICIFQVMIFFYKILRQKF